jgi:MoaA/NifB/PqqE/SkfB family radical SAM enzyme
MEYGYETEAAREFPRYIMYDVNNVCNARCPFCPQSELARGENFDPQHIKWEHFAKTIEETARYPVELVRFTGDGEPLLHPRMTDMIAYARELGIRKLNVTTNGSLLRGKRLAKILASPPHVFDFSLDAFTPETYAKYRIGLHFDTTMKNVHEFLRLRDPKVTKVIVSMIHHPGLDKEVEDFRSYWTGRADMVAIRRLHSNLGLVKVVQPMLPSPRWPCTHLWQRLVIDFRGHIRFCPIDWHDKSYVADVDDMSLHQAWHGPMLETLRRRHLQNDYKGCGVCEKCNDWANTPWTEGWVDMMKKQSLQVETHQAPV